MADTSLVTVPLQISPELLAKAREAILSVAPGKRVKLTFALDTHLNLQVGAGVKPISWFTLGVYGARDAAGELSGVVAGGIEFIPVP